jgi:hypothetical protein
MLDLAALRRRTSSPLSEGQPELALLVATVTGKKAKELEAKLHRLVIGQEEAIHEIVRTYQTYIAGLSPEGRPIKKLPVPRSYEYTQKPGDLRPHWIYPHVSTRS